MKGVPGSEGAHPKPAPRRLRFHLAVYGLVLCGALGILALANGFGWVGWPLIGLAVLALADVAWLSWERHLGRWKDEEA